MSQELCNRGNCKQTRLGLKHEIHDSIYDKKISTPKILDPKFSNPEFDDLLIEHTKERISQELSLFSSLETKAGIMLSTLFILSTLLLSTSLITTFGQSIQNNNLLIGILIPALCFFIVPVVTAFTVLVPRKKYDFLDPVTMNNDASGMSIDEIKHTLRHNLIEGFEDLQQERQKDSKKILLGFVCLGIGSFLISIMFIFSKLF